MLRLDGPGWLALAAEQTSEAILVRDREGRYLWANAPAQAFLGRPLADVIGRLHQDVYPGPGAARVAAEDRVVMATGAPVAFSCRIERPDGEFELHAARKLPWRGPAGEVAGVLVLSRIAAVGWEAALQASEARHQQLLAHSGDLIFSADAGERVTYVSPSSRRLLALEPDELLGTRLMPRVHPDDRALAWRALAELRGGAAEATLTVRVLHRDGRWLWFEAKAAAIRDPRTGEVREVLATARDVGERLAREEAERAQLAVLREADTLKSAFMGMVSHELRTPLHVLMGWQEVLAQALQAGPPERPAEVLGKLRDVTAGLARLVDDLLDLSQVQAGTFAVRTGPTDVAAAIAAARAQLAPLASQHGLALEADLEPGLPRVDADPDRLHQVLVNLVGNAVKFTPAGGRVVISARVARGRVRLAVEDTGVGIGPDDLARIFEPFVQADMGLTRSAGGVGIGLAICRAIVEAHGARIRVRSRPGKGSVFEFALRMSP